MWLFAMAAAGMLRNATVLKGFSISGSLEYPEKLGNALAHKVFKPFRTFLGHPGGTAGPASRQPRAAQGGVMISFSRLGLESNSNPFSASGRPAQGGVMISFHGPAQRS